MPFYLERVSKLVKPLEVGVGVCGQPTCLSPAKLAWRNSPVSSTKLLGILLAVVVSCCGKSLEGPGTATGAGRLSHAVGTALSEAVCPWCSRRKAAFPSDGNTISDGHSGNGSCRAYLGVGRHCSQHSMPILSCIPPDDLHCPPSRIHKTETQRSYTGHCQ